MPPAQEDPPLTASQAERVLGFLERIAVELEHAHEEDVANAAWRAKVTPDLESVGVYFDAQHRKQAEADADLAQASTKLATEKRNTDAAKETVKAEWIQRLTPGKIVAIISTASLLLGGGGVASGAAGRFQAAWDAFTGRGYDNVSVEPPVGPEVSP